MSRRVVSISIHTGPVKVTVQERVAGVEAGAEKWKEVDSFTANSGESKTSLSLGHCGNPGAIRFVLEAIDEQPQVQAATQQEPAAADA